jgi:hypothetical protein
MANNYTIQFKSLRAGTLYTLAIGGGTGSAIALHGGAEPFVTQEDSDEDQFTPIRTQSGTIRIVDNGKAADGVTAFDWHDLLPKTDTARPVTLSHVVGSTTIIDWQGFIQAQNYGSTLYGNPQEHEFPVQCPLTVLSSVPVPTNETQLSNFAYLLDKMLTATSPCTFSTIYVEGGSDALTWLQKKFDWQNFLTETESGVEPDYNYGEILEDVCKFWGWTIRTQGDKVYLTCADDQSEQTFLILTRAQLTALGQGATGGTTGSFESVTISGDVFASMDNDDYQQRGPNKALVKADCNAVDTLVQFAPQSVRNQMEVNGYTWVQGDEDLVGYFTTQPITSFTSKSLDGTAPYGNFTRRQDYESTDQENAVIYDMINSDSAYRGTPLISLQTKRAIMFSGGSIKLSGKFLGATSDAERLGLRIRMRLGVGMTRQTAQWWYMDDVIQLSSTTITSGWRSTPQEFSALIKNGGELYSTGIVFYLGLVAEQKNIGFPWIPMPANAYGYLFIDFMESRVDATVPLNLPLLRIGNFTIDFSRDQTTIPTSTTVVRARTITKERQETAEYKSSNTNQTEQEWSADCIFASDNNMVYGYGLLMNPDGSYMANVTYGSTSEQPEQHLANRVTAYWAQAKRMLSPDLIANASIGTGVTVMDITPRHKVTMDGTTFHPIAIDHNWRDDVVSLTLLEMTS